MKLSVLISKDINSLVEKLDWFQIKLTKKIQEQ